MNNHKYKCGLVSDFNLDLFSAYLNNDKGFPIIESILAPFGQASQTLMQKDSDYWNNNLDFAIIWTRPEGVIPSFNNLLNFNTGAIKDIQNEVDQFASLLLNISGKVRFLFIPTWIIPTYHRGFGMLEMKKGIGITNTLMQMNLRLSEILDHNANIFLFDTQKWINAAGRHAFNPKLWYRGKIAFGNKVYKEAIKDIKSALKAAEGQSKKIILVDLDDTLWGGIVGDLGWENIKLGGHSPIGEAFKDFQLSLKSYANRGILLGIVSKNEESTAIEAINNHPEMMLRTKDFAGWKINWKDKAQNIVDLVYELNLGLQSVVFIDDNPRERARVRESLPEVYVPEWPENCMLYKSTLLNMRCFDTPSISREDIERSRMYYSEKQRKNLKDNLGSLDDWLKSLETTISVEELKRVNLQRTTQLLNKSNQMNLTTRRMTESELLDWANMDGHRLWTFRVSDKLGDSGLTGIISIEVQNKTAKIIDFVMSCRVMGCKVEESMLFIVTQYARNIGLDEVVAEYIPTKKNNPCLEFWKNSDFYFVEKNNFFIWDLKKDFNIPDHIEILIEEKSTL